jgi:hypothetical protein
MLHGGAKQCIGTLALAMALSIRVNSTSMSWQHVYMPLKSYLVYVDNQACFMALMLSHAGDGAGELC